MKMEKTKMAQANTVQPFDNPEMFDDFDQSDDEIQQISFEGASASELPSVCLPSETKPEGNHPTDLVSDSSSE